MKAIRHSLWLFFLVLLISECAHQKQVTTTSADTDIAEPDPRIKTRDMSQDIVVANDTSRIEKRMAKVGQRDADSSARFIAKQRPHLQYMFNERIAETSNFRGKIHVSFRVSANGSVVACDIIGSTTGDPIFDARVVQEILKWQFPPIGIANDTTTFNHTFLFATE